MTILNARRSHYHISMSHEVTGDMPELYMAVTVHLWHVHRRSRSRDGGLVSISGHQSRRPPPASPMAMAHVTSCQLLSLFRIFYI